MSRQSPEDYLARKVNGDCVQMGCPRKQSANCLLCEPHVIKRNARQAVYRARRDDKAKEHNRQECRRWRKAMKKAGRCQVCGYKRLASESRCLECHKTRRIREGTTPLPVLQPRIKSRPTPPWTLTREEEIAFASARPGAA